MKLNPDCMKAHNDYLGRENHTFICLRDFHAAYGLDFKVFLREGLDRDYVEATVGPNDPALNQLLRFLDSEEPRAVTIRQGYGLA